MNTLFALILTWSTGGPVITETYFSRAECERTAIILIKMEKAAGSIFPDSHLIGARCKPMAPKSDNLGVCTVQKCVDATMVFLILTNPTTVARAYSNDVGGKTDCQKEASRLLSEFEQHADCIVSTVQVKP